ncbi:hypothetical protein LCGC14_2350550, partial [marine sediment metagenome]
MEEAAEELQPIEPEIGSPSLILTEWERILLYGPGSTGKTFTAATAPEPQWWLTPGNKDELKTMFSKEFLKKHGRKEFSITSVLEDRQKGQVMDNPSGYDRCCLAVDGFLEWNEREGIGTKTIIVDNATVLEEYMMSKAIFAEYMLASNVEKTVLKAERDFGIRRPHDTTYGGAQSFMDRWVSWLRELPFHLVFIAHDYEVSVPVYEGSRERVLKSVRPLFVGVQRTSIPNKFSNVWYSMVSGGGRSRTWGIQ